MQKSKIANWRNGSKSQNFRVIFNKNFELEGGKYFKPPLPPHPITSKTDKFFRYNDQWITTISLLKHRICNVPKESGLWKHKGSK